VKVAVVPAGKKGLKMKKRTSSVRSQPPRESASGSWTAPPAQPAKPGSLAEEPLVDLRRVRFGYFHPDAREVFVVGTFNNWNPRANPMRRDALGDWSTEVELPAGEYHYRFMVDGAWRDDPCAAQTALNSFGSFDAVVVVA
jgi:hypothetical protein